MTIHIENLKFKCIIGILDFERVEPQDVIINLTIEYNYTDQFIDYTEVVQLIKSSMENDKFQLIEDALDSLSTKLKEKFSLINTLNLKITKPSILPDCTVSVSISQTFNS